MSYEHAYTCDNPACRHRHAIDVSSFAVEKHGNSLEWRISNRAADEIYVREVTAGRDFHRVKMAERPPEPIVSFPVENPYADGPPLHGFDLCPACYAEFKRRQERAGVDWVVETARSEGK